MQYELHYAGACCIFALSIACGEGETPSVAANHDAGDGSADAAPNVDGAAPVDGGTTRRFRFVHSLSNLGAPIEICIRPRSSDPPLKVPLTQAEFPDGIPYGAATGFVTVSSDLTTEQRVYFDLHRGPIDECPAFNGLSDAPPSFITFGLVLLISDAQWFTTGPAGLVASPPGEPVALCGPSFAEPCTNETAGVSWFWTADDAMSEPPDPNGAQVAVISTLAGTMLATLCWDPDDTGPAPPILVADLERDGLATPHTPLPPLVSGRLFAFEGGGVSCTTAATPIAELTLPASQVAPGTTQSIAAGTSGRIWLVGQVTQAPSSPAATAKIVLLPGVPPEI